MFDVDSLLKKCDQLEKNFEDSNESEDSIDEIRAFIEDWEDRVEMLNNRIQYLKELT